METIKDKATIEQSLRIGFSFGLIVTNRLRSFSDAQLAIGAHRAKPSSRGLLNTPDQVLQETITKVLKVRNGPEKILS
jgi:hypothetical protein